MFSSFFILLYWRDDRFVREVRIFVSGICASSASARHQLQRSLMLEFAHAPGTWPSSSPAAPGSRHGRIGSSWQTLILP